jgi:uncharacterized integral membrane protein
VLAVAITIFALQNSDSSTVRFNLAPERAVAALVIVSFVAGLLIAAVPLWIRLGIWRSRARAREARLGVLESAAAERDRQAP